ASAPPSAPAPATSPATAGSSTAPAAAPALPTPAAAPPPTPPKALSDSPPPAAAPASPKVVQREDGSMLVDDRFFIKGKGTKAEPYQIPWDFLASAEETYKPRLGQKNLPDRLSLVKDKYVKVTGYVAFPIMAQEPDEMLAMLNQWDGCCIGVPPTPYDAIEV